MSYGWRFVIGMAIVGAMGLSPADRAEASDTCAGRCHKTVRTKAHTHSGMDAAECEDCHQVQEEGDPTCKSKKVFAAPEDPGVCLDCHDAPDAEHAHPAIEMGCLSCHDPHGGKDAANLKAASVAEQCADCHDVSTEGPKGGSIHGPVKAGDCVKCHDPHASKHSPLLRQPREKLCVECHTLDKLTAKENPMGSLHGPVRAGACLSCHFPHQGPSPKLLRQDDDGLCLGCHGPKADPKVASKKRIKNDGDFVHPALDAAGCRDCHLPHGSRQEHLLKAKQTELCYECHDAHEEPVVHGAVTLGRCSTCHEPHAGEREYLLRAEGSALCFTCHADDLTGRKSEHAPAKDGQCLTCHLPHGAQHHKLLRRGPTNVTCLSCHEAGAEGAVEKTIAGKVAHVHSPVAEGCTVCHDPHGSNAGRSLVDDVPGLCVRCHSKQNDGRHAFTTFDAKPHPIAGKPDPSRPGRTMACTSCHNPHGSDNPKLFYEGKDRMGMCGRCHEEHRQNEETPTEP